MTAPVPFPIRLPLSILIVLVATSVFAQDLTVAAAADLQFAMQDIAGRFKNQTGKQVKVIYGSSGNFTQQLRNSAPFDLFFSANLEYPEQLKSEGLIEDGSLYPYARGKIVLWVPNSSPLDLHLGMRGLLDTSLKKIAIANPQHAPYGKAAVAAMQAEGLYEQVKDKLVFGENISQAASFVASGAADAGMVALSLAISPKMKEKGRYIEVPTKDYPPIEQACVILRSSHAKALAKQFLDFVQTDAIKELLRQYGFDVHQNDAK